MLRQGKAETRATPAPGFALDLPFAPGPLDLELQGAAGLLHRQSLPGFTDAALRRAQRGRALPFLLSLLRLLPVIWRWKIDGDLGARETVKEALSLVPRAPAGRLVANVLSPAPPVPAPGPFAIVMPVFNGLELLQAVLARLEAHSPEGVWHLVLVDDASTEPGLGPWLADWAAQRVDRVTVLRNAENLGFVGTANRGLEAARAACPGQPVILLNSDALVPAGWAARLLAPLSDPSVASVTPFSNDAELMTVPAISRRHDLRPAEADWLAEEAARLNAGAVDADLPAGVGFCMALAPRFLELHPQFDTAFGRGYGEEVDWCRKAIAAGGRHVVAADLFVEHRGGASFGTAEKQKLLERNAARLSARYPGFDAEVRRFVAEDPLVTARLALGLSLLAVRAKAPVPIWLAHSAGGGAEADLQTRLARATRDGPGAVVLRVGRALRWRLELHMDGTVTAADCPDLEPVLQLIARLPRRRIIYSCGVGDSDPARLPDVLLTLSARGETPLPGPPQPVEVLLHDYFPISPSYTLLGADGRWQGVPRPGSDDPAHRWRDIDLAGWQARWGRLLRQAERVEVFSNASRDILAEAYPQAAARIAVAPHQLPIRPPRLRPGRAGDGVPVIGVLGNIGPHKGADIVSNLSRDLAASGAARLVLIGRLAPEFSLAPPARVHGPYRMEDLPGLVARYGLSAWLIPSIWPETFSFTTHEALATGLPVVAFDLGAQGDAVRQAPNGHAVPLPGPKGVDSAVLLQALGWETGSEQGKALHV